MKRILMAFVALALLSAPPARGVSVPYYWILQDCLDRGCPASPDAPRADCQGCAEGMPRWWVSEPYINLWLADEPVFYTTSLGTKFSFRLSYKQRDTRPPNTTSTNTFVRMSIANTPCGPWLPSTGWNHNWYSFIHFGAAATSAGADFTAWQATVYYPGGGQGFFAFDQKQDPGTGNTLQPMDGHDVDVYPVSAAPATSPATIWNGAADDVYGMVGFRLTYPDGTQDVYGQVTPPYNFGYPYGDINYPYGPVPGLTYSNVIYDHASWSNAVANFTTSGLVYADALLTERIDRAGNSTHFQYGTVTSVGTVAFYYLSAVVDPDGKTNTLSYDSGLNLTNVTTPYGQSVSLAWSGTNLTRITDAAGMSTTFTYDNNNLISTMVTPYGTNRFDYLDFYYSSTNIVTSNVTLLDNAGGSADLTPVNRAITVTRPDLSQELYLYRYDAATNGVPQFIPPALVPTNTTIGTLDIGDTNIPPSNPFGQVSLRNTFHWNARQYANLSTTTVTNLSPGDYTNAAMKHWLADQAPADIPTASPSGAYDQHFFVSQVLSFERAASADGVTPGQLTFYDYSGKTAIWQTGGNPQAGDVAQVMPDGTPRLRHLEYDTNTCRPSSVASTYSGTGGAAAQRTWEFAYYSDAASAVISNSTFGSSTATWTYPRLKTVTGPDSTVLLHASAATTTTNTSTVADSSFRAWSVTQVFPSLPVAFVTNALGEVSSVFHNGRGQVSGASLASGLTLTNYYGPDGYLAQSTALELSRSTGLGWSNGWLRNLTNELGLAVTLDTDPLGRLVELDFPDATSISNIFDNLDLAGRKDRLGNWTYFGHDRLRHLTQVTDANGGISLLGWCGCGALTSITNALNQVTTRNYDWQSRLTNIVFADGSTLFYFYDALGRPTNILDGTGRTLQLAYNIQDLITNISDANGTRRAVAYDLYDRPVLVTDARGITISNHFDALGRTTSRTWPDGLGEGFGYATNGLAAYTNRDGRVTRYGRDPAGRLTTETNANGEVTQFAYNAANQIIWMTNGLGATTGWSYNQFGWLTNKVDANGNVVFSNQFNANGWLTLHWTPAGGTTANTFDPVGNVTNVSHSGGPVTPATSMAYNALNQLTNLIDGLGTNVFTYATNGQLAGESGLWPTNGISFAYTQGNRTGMSITSAVSIQTTMYAYDSGWRMTGISSPVGTFDYLYGSSASALVQGILLPNAAAITNTYDSLSRLTGTAMLNHWGHVLDGYNYIPDPLGLRTNITRNLGMTTNVVSVGYDNLGQLTSWSAKEWSGTLRENELLGFSFDAADNLFLRTNGALIQTFNVNALNELASVTRTGPLTVTGATPAPATNVTVNGSTAELYGDLTFASPNHTLADGANSFTNIAQNRYGLLATNTFTANLAASNSFACDLNGNLTSDGAKYFLWDAENRLTNVYVPSQWKLEFGYDGLGRRRVLKQYTWASSAWSKTNEVRYVFDGMLPVQERDTNNVPLVTYTRGLDLSGSLAHAGGIGGLLARTDNNGPTYYHSDGAGNITALMDGYQDIVARYLYGPFGKLLGQWGKLAAANTMQFSSMPYYSLAGITAYYGRFYDASLQRWLNNDPTGEAGGINLYGFNFNNPINFFDATGFGIWSTLSDAAFGWVGNSIYVDPAQIQNVNDQQAFANANAQHVADQGKININEQFDFATMERIYGVNNNLQTAGNMQAVAAGASTAGDAALAYLTVQSAIVSPKPTGCPSSSATSLAVEKAAADAPDTVDHIVLGLESHGLEETAANVGGRTLMGAEDYQAAVQAAIANPNSTFTVSLDGLAGSSPYSQVMSAIQQGLTPIATPTNWELAQLYQSGRLSEVTFVSGRGATVVPNPFK